MCDGERVKREKRGRKCERDVKEGGRNWGRGEGGRKRGEEGNKGDREGKRNGGRGEGGVIKDIKRVKSEGKETKAERKGNK